MKNRRTIIWLLLVTVLTIAANAFLYYRRPIISPMQERVVLNPSFVASRIEISRPDEPTAVLEKDGSWRLVAPFVSSVDVQAVLRLLDAFSTMGVEDSLTESELLRLGRTRDDFGLAEPRLTITFADEKGGKREVAFGSETPSSTGVYACLNDKGLVMVLPRALFEVADLDTDVMRERAVFGNSSDFVSGFSLKRPGEAQISFTREGELWRIGGVVASKAKIDEFLALVVDARAKSFVWPVVATNRANVASSAMLAGYGLDHESALSINLRCRDGIDRRILLGHAASESEVYALIHNGGAVVTLSRALKDMLSQDIELFTDSRLFPYEESSVSSFTISDDEANYVVARVAQNQWRLESPIVAPANREIADGILRRMLSLTSVDRREGGLKVSVSNTASGYSVAREAILAEGRIADLRDKDIFKVDPLLIRRIVSGNSISFSRDRHLWTIENAEDKDRSVNERAVEAVISALSPLRAAEIVTLKASSEDLVRYGLEKPYHTVAVDQDNIGSVRRNILIGALARGGRYATIGSTEAVFILPEKTVSILTAPLISGIRK